MKNIYILIFLFLTISQLCNGQYVESFNIPNQGILEGTCATNDPTSCMSFDFSSVNWTLGGNLSGIDSEGFFTKNGYLHSEDLDEEVCWISPTIDISAVPVSSIDVTFIIPAGTTWETSTTVGSIDYMDVKYSVDGGPFITLANVTGCPGSGHTVSVSTCGANMVGPLTFNINESGITGSTLDIQVCIDTNASSDDGHLEEVAVPEGIVLPVRWASLEVKNLEIGNLISWSTVSEINNDRFEIQRMSNLSNDFMTIGTILGMDNSSQLNKYEFVDHEVLDASVVYYRIMQIDLNGKYKYSKVISISHQKNSNSNLTISPNPARESFVISNSENTEKIVRLDIYNMQGQVVKQILNPFQFQNSLEFNTNSLKAGIYYISAIGPNNSNNNKPKKFNIID